MRIYWGLLTILILVLAWAAPAPAGQLVGDWQGAQNGEQWLVQFRADGTFSRRVTNAQQQDYTENGRYQVQGNGLYVQVDGESEGYTLQFQTPSANTLVLYEDGQALIQLSRAGRSQTSPSQGVGRLGRAVPPSQPSQQTTTHQLISDYRPRQNYQANNAGGSIVYTRYEVFRVNTGQQLVNVPTPKLFIMNADGSNQRAFIYPPQFDHAETPNWSPDYRWLLFSSNYQMAKSAMYQDIFSMDRASGVIKRLTGNEWSAGPVKGYGTIVGTVHDDTISAMDQMMGETSTMLSVKNQVMISVQGGGGKIYYAKRTVADLKDQYPDWNPDAKYYNDPYKWLFIIPRVPAGKLWVKAWKSKHMGDMAIIDVEPNAVTEVELVLSKGNYMVSHPSISPDGRYLVGMSTHCYFYPASPTQGKYTVKNEAHGTVVVADLSSPSALPAVWNQMRANGMAAKAPRLSPDGATLALSAGQLETLENLVLCPLRSVVQGYPKPRVLVPYRRVLASHQEANDSPSWSPDGRRLVFVRSAMGAGGNIIANLYTVSASGGTPRQLTQVGQNQAVAYPCWSPDGNSIAFQVVTSKNQTLNITDIAVMNMTSDIYTIRADGGNLRRITSDGRSAEPAWGP